MQVSLARACGGAYTTALCLFTALGAAFFAILRTKADPGTGVLTNLGFYLTVLTGQFTWPAKLFWRQVCNCGTDSLVACCPGEGFADSYGKRARCLLYAGCTAQADAHTNMAKLYVHDHTYGIVHRIACQLLTVHYLVAP